LERSKKYKRRNTTAKDVENRRVKTNCSDRRRRASPKAGGLIQGNGGKSKSKGESGERLGQPKKAQDGFRVGGYIFTRTRETRMATDERIRHDSIRSRDLSIRNVGGDTAQEWDLRIRLVGVVADFPVEEATVGTVSPGKAADQRMFLTKLNKMPGSKRWAVQTPSF